MLLRRHMTFYLSAAAGVAAVVLAWLLESDFAPVIGANVFFVLYLALMLYVLPRLTSDFLKKHAATADEPIWIIFLVTFAIVVLAVASLFLLLNEKPRSGGTELVLTLAAVPLGWATIHMMTAVHYAHEYWQPGLPAKGEAEKEKSKPGRRGGLDFPATPEPSGWDFAYYSFVIGMTAQTSDTSVSSTAMRRITLAHSIVSYFFNTVLVAAAVNTAVSLGS